MSMETKNEACMDCLASSNVYLVDHPDSRQDGKLCEDCLDAWYDHQADLEMGSPWDEDYEEKRAFYGGDY